MKKKRGHEANLFQKSRKTVKNHHQDHTPNDRNESEKKRRCLFIYSAKPIRPAVGGGNNNKRVSRGGTIDRSIEQGVEEANVEAG